MGLGPNLEKFIQIGRHNAQVPKALQQWNVLAIGPVKHPLIESKNAVIAIEKHHTGRVLSQFRLTVDRRHDWPDSFITTR
jgi:hypothetical protein